MRDTLKPRLPPEFRVLSGLVFWDLCMGWRKQLLRISDFWH